MFSYTPAVQRIIRVGQANPTGRALKKALKPGRLRSADEGAQAAFRISERRA